MAITETNITAPTIKLTDADGTTTTLGVIEKNTGTRAYKGVRDNRPGDMPSFRGPVTLTMTAVSGATILFTINSKKVNLGSKKYVSTSKPVIIENGNGFGSGCTTIRAKAYKNGSVSSTTEVVFNIKNISRTRHGRHF